MKFSPLEEFGLRCMIQLGSRAETSGGMTIPELAEAEGISKANIAKILRVLREAGYIAAARGNIGGYHLAKEAVDIKIGEVLAALGGRLYDAGFCGRFTPPATICARSADCTVKSLWRGVQSAVDGILMNLTLEDLLSKKRIQLAVTAQTKVAELV